MNFLDFQGQYKGKNRLHLSWNPPGSQIFESEAEVFVGTVDPLHISLMYTWTYEGEGKSGNMLVAKSAESDEVTAAWFDTWHMTFPIMQLTGTVENDVVLLNGSYQMEGYPEWYWRIEISKMDADLSIKMFNISPEREEEWAVELIAHPQTS